MWISAGVEKKHSSEKSSVREQKMKHLGVSRQTAKKDECGKRGRQAKNLKGQIVGKLKRRSNYVYTGRKIRRTFALFIAFLR